MKLLVAFLILFGISTNKGHTQLPDSNCQKIGLSIGVSSTADLVKNTTADATDMYDTLTAMGFKTKLSINPTRKQVERMLDTLSQRMDNVSVVCIYISAHGLSFNNESFWLPSDAEMSSTYNLMHTACGLNWMINRLCRRRKPRIIVILDACRDNIPPEVMAEYGALVRESLTNFDVIFAYSSSPGMPSYGSVKFRHSYYTAGLLRHLREPASIINILSRLGIEVKDSVKKHLDSLQVPNIAIFALPDAYLNESCPSGSTGIDSTDGKTNKDASYRNDISKINFQTNGKALALWPAGYYTYATAFRLWPNRSGKEMCACDWG